MGDLEKLFVGTMMLTGMLILFLFGLYFDIGDMVAGTFKGHTPDPGSSWKRIRETRSGSFMDEKPAPRARRPRTGGGGGSSRRINYRRYIVPRPPMSRQMLMDREVRRLQRKGFIDEEYIRMKALYEVDNSLVATLDQYDQFMDAENYDGAITSLLEALKGLDEDNHLARRDIFRHLYQAYILAGKDSEASQQLSELTLLHEKIVAIEERAELHQDTESQKYVKQMRRNLGQVREALEDLENAGGMSLAWDQVRKIKSGEQIEVGTEMVTNLKGIVLQNPEATSEVKNKILKQFKTIDTQEYLDRLQKR